MKPATYPNGAIYTGEWNGEKEKHGKGKMTFQDGTKYAGSFNCGLCHGLGILVLPDGSRYEGELLNGKFHGFGVYTRSDKMVYEGQFKDGKPDGQDGTHGIPRQEGVFENFMLKSSSKSPKQIEQARKVAAKARDLGNSL